MSWSRLRVRLELAVEYRIEVWSAAALLGWSGQVGRRATVVMADPFYAVAVQVASAGVWVLGTLLVGAGLLLSLFCESRWPRIVLCAFGSVLFLCLGVSFLFAPAPPPPGVALYFGFGLGLAHAALRGPRRHRLL